MILRKRKQIQGKQCVQLEWDYCRVCYFMNTQWLARASPRSLTICFLFCTYVSIPYFPKINKSIYTFTNIRCLEIARFIQSLCIARHQRQKWKRKAKTTDTGHKNRPFQLEISQNSFNVLLQCLWRYCCGLGDEHWILLFLSTRNDKSGSSSRSRSIFEGNSSNPYTVVTWNGHFHVKLMADNHIFYRC